jgi:MFS family permease
MLVLATLPLVFAIQSIAAWMPTLVSRRYGFTPAEAATWVGIVTMLTAPLGQLAGGRLFDRLPLVTRHPVASMAAAMAAATLATGLILWSDGPEFALAGLVVVNLALGIGSLVGLTALQTMIPAALRAQVNALFFAAVTAAAFGFGPLLVGILSDVQGATGEALGQALMTVTLGALVACGLVLALARRLGAVEAPLAARI